MNETILYSKDANDSIRVYRIGHDGEYIHIHTGVLGGEEVTTHEHVPFGLAGRTQAQQIEMRINSRINKKIDAGYVYSLAQAKNEDKTNNLGYPKAMKCGRYDEEKHRIKFDKNFIQPKLDGHHCSIVNDNGTLVAYSNGGKLINSIDHILNGVDMPIGAQIEGELYHHGTPLQTISSWVRKKQENSLKLRFYCYDFASKECYSKRFVKLQFINYGENAELLETTVLNGKFDIEKIMADYLKRGYEGAVLRMLDYPFESGKRSKGTIKCKPMHFGKFRIDDEFLVVDISCNDDGFAILHCETESGGKFKALCHGTHDYKKYVYENRLAFIGRHVRGFFAFYSKDGIPVQFIAQDWREKHDE